VSVAERLQVFWDARVLEHDTGAGVFEAPAAPWLAVPELHPENGNRVRNMHAVLEQGPVAARLEWRPGREADEAELETVHRPEYIASIRERCAAGGGRITPTTRLGAASWAPILVAAGTSLAAGDAVISGATRMAYALVRPPGHHAQPACADGYCFFNHAALVAEAARRAGVARVAVVDWDVHHGNGTQACFWERGDVLTISLHMRTGLWGRTHQQTGSPGEIGVGDGAGRNVNVELGLGLGDRAYRLALEEVVLPVLRAFRPELLVGACGQDASAFDPNGRMNVSMDGFHAIGAFLRAAAGELCDGRVVLVQEGGYATTYAALCLHATLEGVLGEGRLLPDPLAYVPDDVARARDAVDATRSALSRHWTFPS
jgi:acetoin utilization deacetylase AcuC-like enzyme